MKGVVFLWAAAVICAASVVPVRGNEGGIEYVFCGTIDPMRWFPEPRL